MNYLAHAYLSFKEPGILAGNMISDFVKGKKKFDYPLAIQTGITLHRMIDGFTDNHEATKKAKIFFKPVYGLYAGAFIDIVYDYFLANDKNEFTDDELADFAMLTYNQLKLYQSFFPEKFQTMFYYMQLQNWLYNYRFEKGIYNSFAGLVHRAKYIRDHGPAISIFENHYKELEDCYAIFFPCVREFAYQSLLQLKAGN